MINVKKFIMIICAILVFVLLSAFSLWDLMPKGSVNEVQEKTLSEYEYVKEVGTEIIRCLKEKDKQGLNALFCNKIKDTDYLMKEIDIIFDYIDKNGGLSIEEGKWNSPIGHGSTDYNGKTIEFFACEYKNILIGKKKYNLRFTAYQILKKHLEYENINCLYFLEDTSNSIKKQSIDKVNRDNSNEKKSFLGFALYNRNYNTFKWENIVPKEIEENDLYLIPDNLEDDR